jgi:hypothetical protein
MSKHQKAPSNLKVNLKQPPSSGFYIVNEADRPDHERLAERQPDGTLNYVHPDLRDVECYHGMPMTSATPIEDFGVFIQIQNGTLRGHQLTHSCVKYADGRIRPWQGPASFEFIL